MGIRCTENKSQNTEILMKFSDFVTFPILYKNNQMSKFVIK